MAELLSCPLILPTRTCRNRNVAQLGLITLVATALLQMTLSQELASFCDVWRLFAILILCAALKRCS